MDITLIPDGPLDPRATLARYRLWGEDPTNRLADDAFCRVLRVEGRLVPYRIRWSGTVDEPRLDVRASGARGARVAAALENEVRLIFGLDFDVAGFYRMAKGDPVLSALVEALFGLRPTLSPTALEALVHAIAAQQVNLAFACTLRARLVRRWGTPVSFAGDTVYAFPEPTTLARVRLAALRAMQYSMSKARSIRAVASGVVSGAIDRAALAALADADVIDRLTAAPGIGRWTADWFLARCLGRGAVCPAGDLAVRRAFDHYYGRGSPMSETDIRRHAEAWGPHQNLAIHYLLAGRRQARPATGGGA